MAKKKKADKKKSVFPGLPELPELPEFKLDFDQKEAKKTCKANKNKFQADLKSFLEKSIDMQQSAMDGTKDQFETFFANMMDWEDDVTEWLPEEAPSFFGMTFPLTPKEVMKEIKEWQQLSKDHFTEQADSAADLVIQRKKKVVELIPEPKEEEPEAEAEEEVVEVEAEVVEEKTEEAAPEAEETTEETAETEEAAE